MPLMRMIKHSQFSAILVIVGMMLLFGCTTQEPIVIVVTPTLDPNAITATAVPTLASTQTPTETGVPTLSPTPTIPTETNTPAPSNTPDPSMPTATFRGPVTDPNYVLPTLPPVTTTLVPIPTITPTPGGPTETPGPSPTPVPRLDYSRMGLQIYSQSEQVDFEVAISLAQETGVGWIKVQVNWAFLQPNGPQDTERLQLFERQMESAARPGFNILLSVAKAPAWARSNQTEDGPPDNPQLLADFLTLILNTKVGEVTDAIEVWNEPNLIREWRGSLPFSGGGYMQLFDAAHDAIRAYSPTLTIVTAGLAPVGPNVPGAVDDRAFFQQMYNAGLAQYADIVIGVHPYGWGNAPDARCCTPGGDRGWDEDPRFFFLDTIEAYHNIMVASGDIDAKMWLTEFGWATWEGIPAAAPETWMTYNSAQNQASYAIRAFEIGQSLPYVGLMFLWNLNFTEGADPLRDEVTGYAIINTAVTPRERPLFRILSLATGGSRQAP